MCEHKLNNGILNYQPMSLLLPLFLIILLTWFVGIYLLKRWDILKKHNMSLWGPALMWRTNKGKKLIKVLSRREKFWMAFGDFSIMFCFLAMAAMIGLLLWEVVLSFSIPAEQAPTPQMMLLLPGVNPLIPLSSIPYLIIGIIIAIVIHEFSHGILTMVGKIKIKALGVLLLIIPIGAFVEPDDKQMEKAGKRKRVRVFATGPASNMILAIITAMIFSLGFMGSISSQHDGALVTGVITDSPADIMGLKPWGVIVSLNGSTLENDDDLYEIADTLEPAQPYTMTYYYDNQVYTQNLTAGLVVTVATEGYPAHDAGIKPGMIITRIDGSLVQSEEEFHETMNLTNAGENISVTGIRYDKGVEQFLPYNISLTLADKFDYYQKYFPDKNNDEYRGQGFLGVSISQMGIGAASPDTVAASLTKPLSSVRGFFFYITLPFQGLSPTPDEMTSIYTVTGPLAALPDGLFWVLADCLYWIFWLNFALGTFNVLPAVPLDGGYVFKDSIAFVIGRIKKSWKNEKREDIASKITLGMSLVVLAAILSLILIPRLKLFFI